MLPAASKSKGKGKDTEADCFDVHYAMIVPPNYIRKTMVNMTFVDILACKCGPANMVCCHCLYRGTMENLYLHKDLIV